MYNSRAALDMAVILVILFSFVFQVICDDNMGKCINIKFGGQQREQTIKHYLLYVWSSNFMHDMADCMMKTVQGKKGI